MSVVCHFSLALGRKVLRFKARSRLSLRGHMQRRQFITILGGAAAWPLTARAQQGERMRRIGVLTAGSAADDPDGQARSAVFLQGLQQLGWIDGRNVRIDYRLGAGDADNMRKYAADGRARAGRHSGLWHRDHGAVVAGNPHRADRVCAGHRSGRCRLRR